MEGKEKIIGLVRESKNRLGIKNILKEYFPKWRGLPSWCYDAYIESEAWQEFRKHYKNLPSVKAVCSKCGNSNRLQLHHKSYKALGVEHPRHMMLLCYDCHKIFHRKYRNRLWKSSKKFTRSLDKGLDKTKFPLG